MSTLRSISFVIMRASLDLVSLVLQQRAASRFLKRRITRPEPTRSANAFWGVCGESASITSSFSMRSSCIVYFMPMPSISIERDHTRVSSSKSRRQKSAVFRWVAGMNWLSPRRSWADYTTTRAEWHERLNREGEEQGGSVFRALRCFWRAKRYMLFMLSLPKERNKKRRVLHVRHRGRKTSSFL